MLTEEKRKEFEALAGDTEGRALLAQLLSQAETTTKAADAAGAVYKDAPPWAQDLARRLDALETTVKAPMPAEEMAEAGTTEAGDGLAELDADLGLDEEADPELDGLFADVAQVKTDLVEIKAMLSAMGKMDEVHKMLGELKGTWPQYTAQVAQKDDARAREIADHETRLKELEGGQPRRSLTAGVWGDLTGIPVTKEQAAQLTAQQPGNQIPAGLSGAEADAYRLIFGGE